MSALIAFEATVRTGSVVAAAEALNSSSPAISRHIQYLEKRLSIALFRRQGRGLILTDAGRSYHSAVAAALDGLSIAERQLELMGRSVTLACSYSVSHLVIMPRFSELRAAVGKGFEVNVLTSDYDARNNVDPVNADIVIGYNPDPTSNASTPVLSDQITAVASSDFIRIHQKTLNMPYDHWVDLPRLGFSHDNLGWSSWSDWFQAAGVNLESCPPPVETFSNYVYLLEAATAGVGMALGWRGFVERALRTGTLQTIENSWVSPGKHLYAWLTRQGESNQGAHACMAYLKTIGETSAD